MTTPTGDKHADHDEDGYDDVDNASSNLRRSHHGSPESVEDKGNDQQALDCVAAEPARFHRVRDDAEYLGLEADQHVHQRHLVPVSHLEEGFVRSIRKSVEL